MRGLDEASMIWCEGEVLDGGSRICCEGEVWRSSGARASFDESVVRV